MLVAVSPANRLAQTKIIVINAVATEPLIWTTPRAATRMKVEETFAERGLKPSVMVEVENVELIKKLVKEGEGYCCLCDISLMEEIKKGELVPLRLKEGRILLDIDVIYRKDETLPVSATNFLRFLEESKTFSCTPLSAAKYFPT